MTETTTKRNGKIESQKKGIVFFFTCSPDGSIIFWAWSALIRRSICRSRFICHGHAHTHIYIYTACARLSLTAYDVASGHGCGTSLNKCNDLHLLCICQNFQYCGDVQAFLLGSANQVSQCRGVLLDYCINCLVRSFQGPNIHSINLWEYMGLIEI